MDYLQTMCLLCSCVCSHSGNSTLEEDEELFASSVSRQGRHRTLWGRAIRLGSLCSTPSRAKPLSLLCTRHPQAPLMHQRLSLPSCIPENEHFG